MADDSISQNRSTMKEFLASIATIQGDLSNITAPPFVLASHSTVELPQYWADHPRLFIMPAHGSSSKERALLVLKWFLGSLRNQQYAGRKESEGVKKPLNAFLGELFLGSFAGSGEGEEDVGETKLVSEQVSHHPPVTACYLWNEKHGVRAEGFTCQEITFSGSVSIKQKGYAILHVDKHDEDYLIPVPNVKVKGVLGGTPYPELTGTYSIQSSTGWVSKVTFEGKGFFGGGNKNGLEARVFHVDNPSDDVYKVTGQWNRSFEIHDVKSGKELETYNVEAAGGAQIQVTDRQEQDPWESRRAWGDVIDALERGDMKGVSNAKNVVEEGQRHLRKEEQARGEEWDRVFFTRQNEDPIFEKLAALDKSSFDVDLEGGIWKVDKDAVQKAQRPYHGDLAPDAKASKSADSPATAAVSKSDADHETMRESEAQDGGVNRSPASVLTPTAAPEQGLADNEQLEKLQIQEMLRAKYSSAKTK